MSELEDSNSSSSTIRIHMGGAIATPTPLHPHVALSSITARSSAAGTCLTNSWRVRVKVVPQVRYCLCIVPSLITYFITGKRKAEEEPQKVSEVRQKKTRSSSSLVSIREEEEDPASDKREKNKKSKKKK